MSQLAATSAAQPNSSLKAPRVPVSSCGGRNGGCSRPSSHGAVATPMWAAIGTNSACRDTKVDYGALGSLPSRIPSSTRGHASGPNRRPAARRRSASLPPHRAENARRGPRIAAPLRGLGSSQNKFEGCGEVRRSNFFRAPPRKHSLALGSRALSLALP
jgi:hypothetical protein